jgi:spore maturation protein CgeB
MTRVLFVGYMGRGQTSGMRSAAFTRLGYDVASVDAGTLWRGAGYLARQLGQRMTHGARIERLNAEVVSAAKAHQPRLVWAEKQEYLYPETIERLRAMGAVVAHYNPDPYFTLDWKRTPLADACVKLYDVLVVTKRYELEAYRKEARGKVIYSQLGYDKVGHAPPAAPVSNPQDKVVFVGGWEPRRERLLASAKSVTPDVAIWGYGWRIAQGARLYPLRALRLGRLTPGRRVYLGEPVPVLRDAIKEGEGSNGEIYEDGYARVVAGSKIALGFVREVCPDEHTTRTFEIPAIGGFMLADRTPEHLELFTEGEEAEYFGSDEEYLDKLRYYLANDSARERVALAGHTRCWSSGYSYDDRIKAVMTALAL